MTLLRTDEPIGMSKEQLDTAWRAISKTRHGPCPFCKVDAPAVHGVVHLFANDDQPNFQTTMRASLPMVLVACENCHAVTLYTTDVLDRPAGTPADGRAP